MESATHAATHQAVLTMEPSRSMTRPPGSSLKGGDSLASSFCASKYAIVTHATMPMGRTSNMRTSVTPKTRFSSASDSGGDDDSHRRRTVVLPALGARPWARRKAGTLELSMGQSGASLLQREAARAVLGRASLPAASSLLPRASLIRVTCSCRKGRRLPALGILVAIIFSITLDKCLVFMRSHIEDKSR